MLTPVARLKARRKRSESLRSGNKPWAATPEQCATVDESGSAAIKSDSGGAPDTQFQPSISMRSGSIMETEQ